MTSQPAAKAKGSMHLPSAPAEYLNVPNLAPAQEQRLKLPECYEA